MTLKLNLAGEAYKEFYGKNVEQMPRLIAENRVPMNVSQLMQKRLEVRKSDDPLLKTSYMDNYFDTGDVIAYHPDGRIKIVLDSLTLRQITPKTEPRNGALVLTEEAYNSAQGEEFKKGKYGKINNWLTKKQVKTHPIWRVLARDKVLLSDYADYIFKEGKQRFNYDKAMGVFLNSEISNTPELRAWCVYWLGNRSDALGRNLLDDNGRFLGIAPEAQNVLGKDLTQKTRFVEQQFLLEQILKETGNIEDFAPNQIKRLQKILAQEGYQIRRK